jgi:membrane-associated phospholipid phosphatase
VIRQRIVAALVALVIAVPVLRYANGLSWPFAVIGGFALGAFAFLLVRAIDNLRAWRPRR